MITKDSFYRKTRNQALAAFLRMVRGRHAATTMFILWHVLREACCGYLTFLLTFLSQLWCVSSIPDYAIRAKV